MVAGTVVSAAGATGVSGVLLSVDGDINIIAAITAPIIKTTTIAIKIKMRLPGILRPLPEMAFLSFNGAGGVSGVIGAAVSSEIVAGLEGVIGVEEVNVGVGVGLGSEVGSGVGVGVGIGELLAMAPKPLIAEDGLARGGFGVLEGAGGIWAVEAGDGAGAAVGAAGAAGVAGVAGASGLAADGVPHLGQKVAPSAIMVLQFKHCFIFLLSLTPYKRQPTQRVRTKLRIDTIYYNINRIRLML